MSWKQTGRLNNRGEFLSLEGFDELLKTFENLAQMPDEKTLENRLFARGRALQKDIRRAAPKGPGNTVKGIVGGNLRKGVVARKFRKKIKGSPAVFVAMDFKKAPHAYLVEYGTKGLRYATKKARTAKPDGYWVASFIGRDGQRHTVKIKHTGVMPQTPFFRNTVDTKRAEIVDGIKKDTQEKIKEIWTSRHR